MKTSFLDTLSLVDCAAQSFAAHHPTQCQEGLSRAFLRHQSVQALRYLWRTGTAETRWIVATRVGLWLRRTDALTAAQRVKERETAREVALAQAPE